VCGTDLFVVLVWKEMSKANLSSAQVKALGDVIAKIKQEAIDGQQEN
jgi:hypothetical protein